MLDFLIATGAGRLPHGSRSLLHHLIGTYGTLRRWRCDDDVCYAGLFHSVYGTPYYREIDVQLSRQELSALLGSKAESLVFAYSETNMSELFHVYVLRSQPARLKPLVLIALANLFDQWDGLTDDYRNVLLERDGQIICRLISSLDSDCATDISRLVAQPIGPQRNCL
jgi:hypothetical protein